MIKVLLKSGVRYINEKLLSQVVETGGDDCVLFMVDDGELRIRESASAFINRLKELEK